MKCGSKCEKERKREKKGIVLCEESLLVRLRKFAEDGNRLEKGKKFTLFRCTYTPVLRTLQLFSCWRRHKEEKVHAVLLLSFNS